MTEHTRTVTAAVTRRSDRRGAGTLPVCGQQAPEDRAEDADEPSSCSHACWCTGRAPRCESPPAASHASRRKHGSVRPAFRREQTGKTARTCRQHQLGGGRGRERGRERGRQREREGGGGSSGRKMQPLISLPPQHHHHPLIDVNSLRHPPHAFHLESDLNRCMCVHVCVRVSRSHAPARWRPALSG